MFSFRLFLFLIFIQVPQVQLASFNQAPSLSQSSSLSLDNCGQTMGDNPRSRNARTLSVIAVLHTFVQDSAYTCARLCTCLCKVLHTPVQSQYHTRHRSVTACMETPGRKGRRADSRHSPPRSSPARCPDQGDGKSACMCRRKKKEGPDGLSSPPHDGPPWDSRRNKRWRGLRSG